MPSLKNIFSSRLGVCAGLGTLGVLAGQVFPHPSAVRDAVTGEFPSFASIAYPKIYLFFSPFLQFADHFTVLSIRQHIAFFAFLNAAWFLFRAFGGRKKRTPVHRVLREAGLWLAFVLVYASAAAAVILIPRPMARIALSDPDRLAVDFHSHTSYSWDARKSFTPEQNMRWHSRAGFDAAFITDHNRVDGATEAWELFLEGEPPRSMIPLRGEEVSLHQSHWALLGNETLVPNGPYDRGLDGIRDFLTMVKQSPGLVAVASLPEYWLYHWENGLEQFAGWGASGFEIVNSAPQALEFTPAQRRRVAEFCRERNLIVTGITDSHGWGSTAYVWNILKIPGWKELPPEELERAVISALKAGGYGASQVLVRVRAEPAESALGLIFDPVKQIGAAVRTIPPAQAASCLFWLWLPCLPGLLRKKR
jgi:hypothetical protein